MKEIFVFFDKNIELDLESFDPKVITETKVNESKTIDENPNLTKRLIVNIFQEMDSSKGWEYAFRSQKDYNLFVDLLTNFFEYKTYSIPDTIIQLKRTCKTRVAKALGEIHKELSENSLTGDTKYFEIIRILNHFKDRSDFELAKAMQR